MITAAAIVGRRPALVGHVERNAFRIGEIEIGTDDRLADSDGGKDSA